MSIAVVTDGPVLVVTIDRAHARNAVDPTTADELVEAFTAFDGDDALAVAVLTGSEGHFCAGADLKAVASQDASYRIHPDGPGPLGPSRMLLGKPVIAAVEGHAVAGGLELALWCDLRVAAKDAVFGVYCRRWGVPLMDGGTVRLPRIVGQGRALDMILTGRGVGADEALSWGLCDRVVDTGQALAAATELAHQLARLPQTCLRSDRLSAYQQWSRPFADALRNEGELGLAVLLSGETVEGASRFAEGAGRHGASA